MHYFNRVKNKEPGSIPYFLKCTIIFCKQQNHSENRERVFYFWLLLLKTNFKVMICFKRNHQRFKIFSKQNIKTWTVIATISSLLIKYTSNISDKIFSICTTTIVSRAESNIFWWELRTFAHQLVNKPEFRKYV